MNINGNYYHQMKKVLIVSSTRNTNYDLSSIIKEYYDKKEKVQCDIISLEDLDLPLYTPTLEGSFKEDNSFPSNIEKIKQRLCSSDALIWCSPEYNGGISPILTNMIAWVSRGTENWKEGFINKHSLICTSSGGNGKNFVKGFKLQLSYLGSLVLDRSIIRTKKSNINKEEFKLVLEDFYKNIS